MFPTKKKKKEKTLKFTIVIGLLEIIKKKE